MVYNLFYKRWSVNIQVAKFKLTDTKLYVLVETLSTKNKQNYYNDENKVLKEQLAGKNVDQK